MMPGQRSVVQDGDKTFFLLLHSHTHDWDGTTHCSRAHSSPLLSFQLKPSFYPPFFLQGATLSLCSGVALQLFPGSLTMSSLSSFPSSLPVCMKKLKLQLWNFPWSPSKRRQDCGNHVCKGANPFSLPSTHCPPEQRNDFHPPCKLFQGLCITIIFMFPLVCASHVGNGHFYNCSDEQPCLGADCMLHTHHEGSGGARHGCNEGLKDRWQVDQRMSEVVGLAEKPPQMHLLRK